MVGSQGLANSQSTVIGSSASSLGETNQTLIGFDVRGSVGRSIALGRGIRVNHGTNFVVGQETESHFPRVAQFGDQFFSYKDTFLGHGSRSDVDQANGADPDGLALRRTTVQPSAKLTEGSAGGEGYNFRVAGGRGVGDDVPGSIYFATAQRTGLGNGLQPLVERAWLDEDGAWNFDFQDGLTIAAPAPGEPPKFFADSTDGRVKIRYSTGPDTVL